MIRSLARPRQSKQQDKLLAGNQSLNILTFNNNNGAPQLRLHHLLELSEGGRGRQQVKYEDRAGVVIVIGMISVTVNVAIIER